MLSVYLSEQYRCAPWTLALRIVCATKNLRDTEVAVRAIRIEKHGGPEVLELKDIPAPEQPGRGQAIVRVIAAGVNFMDVGHQRGTYPRDLPFTPGWEGSGIVESTGEAVGGVKPGDRVAFWGQPGAYAEAVLVDAGKLVPLPEDFTFEQGAAFLTQGLTAQYLIHEFRKPKAGEFVLVHAAAGGVGGLLVQWMRHLGAVVIGTVSSKEKALAAQKLGAEHVIVYTEQDFVAETKRMTGDRGADLIFDGVGRTTSKGNLEAIAVRGHIVIFGASGGPPDPVAPYSLMRRSISLCGGSLQYLSRHEERVSDVVSGIREGWLKLPIGGVFPLEQAARAHKLLEGRTSQGKLILTMVNPLLH
jgi:NADPH2:quinone reductase